MEFSTAKVAELAGASVRMVDHWARKEVLRPSGHDASGKGSKRRYTIRDVVALQTIRRLREAGCPLPLISRVIRHLIAHYPATLTEQALARLTLLTDGNAVYLLTDEREVMRVLTQQAVWSVPLGKLIAEASRKIAALPQEWIETVGIAGRSFRLVVSRQPADRDYSVECIELPGFLQHGKTAKDAVENAKRGLVSVLTYRERRHRQGFRAGPVLG
jgi:DNA-binding transcriptional MerR regulator